MEAIHIRRKSEVNGTVKGLPSSKSLSNRALIIEALAGNQSLVSNLSSARDTILMKKLVGSPDKEINVMDAGTTMRFLTAYFAVTSQRKVLTGSARMKERPIGLLVEALRNIGASIDYLEREGYPPIETRGFKSQQQSSVTIPGNVSSQYISALMMVAPLLPSGLTINLTGTVGSRPYIAMTASLMEHFGAKVTVGRSDVVVPCGTYQTVPYRVEPDWSAASYWFAFTALSKQARILLPGVTGESRQGDIAIIDIMRQLGVNSTFDEKGLTLTKGASGKSIDRDFIDCPDLAQTVIPACAVLGVRGTFKGLESLLIKETDRIAALRTELGKLNTRLVEPTAGSWVLEPGVPSPQEDIEFSTYHDHRMAMGLAPLATRMNVIILDPKVVDKSYPAFWEDIKGLGFEVTDRPRVN